MSRAFWMAVGAVGGVTAYREATKAAARARELGPLGTAHVVAAVTSRWTGRAAHGLERLDHRARRRSGRVILGEAQEVPSAVPRAGSLAELLDEPAAAVPRARAAQAPPTAEVLQGAGDGRR